MSVRDVAITLMALQEIDRTHKTDGVEVYVPTQAEYEAAKSKVVKQLEFAERAGIGLCLGEMN